jgi:hypothetical protein
MCKGKVKKGELCMISRAGNLPVDETKWVMFILSALCRGGMALWSAKVPKALCQSSKGHFARSHASKKQRHFVLC